MEALNTLEVRCFAIEQLRRIDTTMGIRHASLLASMAYQSLTATNSEYVLAENVFDVNAGTSPFQIPAISFA